MSDKLLDMLKKRRDEREKIYQQQKGMIQLVNSMKLDSTAQAMIKLFEYIIEGFKTSGDHIDLIFEAILAQNKQIANLESEVANLRNTLDTLNENR